MTFDFLTPELFDTLIWAVIISGGLLAVWRLVTDLRGPSLYPDGSSSGPTGPKKPPTPMFDDED